MDLDAQENGGDDSLAQARQQGDGGLLGLTDQSQIDRDLLG